MALFGSKKKTEKVEKAVATKATKTTAPAAIVIAHDIILRPRITEKSGLANESANIYTFEVVKNATKHSIAHAIKAHYKVTPLKVRTINLPAKEVLIRGKHGVKPAVKKALVYLKKGDKIEFA